MRRWLYSTDDVFEHELAEEGSVHVPEFLQPVRELFFEAGHQLRIIDKLRTGLGVESAVVQAIRQISKSEELEMTNICLKCNDAWALCRTEFGHVGFSSWFADAGNQAAFLPFQHNALHEVCLLSSENRFRVTGCCQGRGCDEQGCPGATKRDSAHTDDGSGDSSSGEEDHRCQSTAFISRASRGDRTTEERVCPTLSTAENRKTETLVRTEIGYERGLGTEDS